MKNIFIAWLLLCVFIYAQEADNKKTENSTKVQDAKKDKVQESVSETFVITTTGQKQKITESSVAIGKIEGKEIEHIRPAHPAEVTNRISGVIVNNLGGESHFTSIRNNLSTGANYLFLENGVPTRSTGYFNHNALYEINVPQAGGLEIIKGPGSALYGSDAMHGVINVLSGEIPDEQLIKLGAEYGTTEWYRHLVTYGDRINDEHAFRLDLNQTFMEGWRDYTDYTRHSATAQWLWTPSHDFTMKTVASYNYVDQSSVSGLSKHDWKHNPEDNYYRLPGRDVESFRLSTKMTKVLDDDSEINITPYFRHSYVSGLIPSWKLSTNPAAFANNSEIWDSGFQSFGTLMNYTQYFDKWDSMLVLGFDFDYSPGKYEVEQTTLEREFNSNGNVYFNDYARTGNMIYDFESTYTSYSPYIHFEMSPVEKLRLDFGLRYDFAEFEIDQKLNSAGAISDDLVSFEQLSPKFGLVYDYVEKHQVYASYRRGFRAPSVGSLFAAPASEDSLDLEPTTIDSFDLGFRGEVMEDLFYDITFYYMEKKDDIITYRDPNNPSVRFRSNNGETSHRGIELTLKYNITEELDFRVTSSWSKHKYEKWDLGAASYPGAPEGTALEGNELERAPKYYQTFILDYHPAWMKGGRIEAELINMGSYYTDSENTDKYVGHELINLRAEYPLTDKLKLYGRLINLLDRHNTSYTSSSEATGYRPGEPRSLYMGFEYKF
ncbi:MAG: TonB-dependent receptor [Lentisphaeraceae bacterium]|nr:TonB-dependent receptor [Lentisphaeraceae bacterium]